MDDLVRAVPAFRDERGWKQFHNPKDLAISIMLEAARSKLRQNATKYPVEGAGERRRKKKYGELVP
jgi:hypothetical protein